MEFFDEESRPRFLLQSRSSPKPDPQSETLDHLHKPTLFISLSLSAFFLTLALFYFHFDPFQSIFIWISISLLIGPFAPTSFTAGDIRVGQGPAIQPQSPPRHHQTVEPDQKRSRFRVRKPDPNLIETVIETVTESGNEIVNPRKDKNSVIVVEEGNWNDGDVDLLKKLIIKYPVGMPGRWEAVSEAFSGRYKVESVVKMAKSLGERKVGDSDSFSRFLKDRKAVDKRVDEVIENERENVSNLNGNGNGWSSGEDIALLNALKAFPKDAANRWEKIAAAVPGRSKAACMKRVSDLKKDFRSSKG